ncbi:PKD domain-containing protein [Thalassotalea sp. PS06]|uniref:PKD domain-containing protein n=1 Tax=Thalassotalea sp. PS06 TaxID=2594005 RepID=UPI0011658DE2|nr:PKD domain-containing protein [Thalassotalea sp. PS06]QDP02645.1 PKD domain-containing protein [Thalassotalea sp. PS06]
MSVKSFCAAAVLSALSVGTMASSNPHTLSTFQKNRIEYLQTQQFYLVSSNNQALLNRVKISYHNQLEGSTEAGLILQLNAKQIADLTGAGVQVSPASQWQGEQINQVKGWSSLIPAGQAILYQGDINADADSGSDTIEHFPCYKTVEATYRAAQQMAEAHPNLVQWQDIGDSWEKVNGFGGYDLMVLTLGETSDEDKPILFIHASMHAREYAPAKLALDFAEELVDQYVNDGDHAWVLKRHQVQLLLMMNPDARKKAETGLSWRKNTNQNFCASDDELIGVDLNRNFTHTWGKGEGSSDDECNLTYHGPMQASEPETQAVEAYLRNLFSDNRGPLETDAAPITTQGMHIDLHSYGELVLYPWGHTYNKAPNAVELATLARKFAFKNDHSPMQSIGLYATDGTSESISYGELGVPHFTFELGGRFFETCDQYENQIRDKNIDALLYASKVVHAPYILPKGPEITDIIINGVTDALVTKGTELEISVVADDNMFKVEQAMQQTSYESFQNIAKVQYSLNQHPDDEHAEVHELTAVDGGFDASQEFASTVLATDQLEAGKHVLYFRSQDADGNWGTVSARAFEIGDNASPVADFSVQCRDLVCEFDAAPSYDPDGNIQRYFWEVSGDEPVTTAKVAKTFSLPGSYEVRLTVLDNQGMSGQSRETVTVNISNQMPMAVADISCEGLKCSFDASNSADPDGEIVSYYWQLGDGATATGAIVEHDYQQPGEFAVSLMVEDDKGLTQVAQQNVLVEKNNEVPVAIFSAQCENLSCTLDASASQDVDGEITAYTWYLNGEVIGQAQVLNYTFSAAGGYEVTLMIADNDGAEAQFANQVIAETSSQTGAENNLDDNGGKSSGSLSWLSLLALMLLRTMRTRQ